jgi:hypothetical protein
MGPAFERATELVASQLAFFLRGHGDERLEPNENERLLAGHSEPLRKRVQAAKTSAPAIVCCYFAWQFSIRKIKMKSR